MTAPPAVTRLPIRVGRRSALLLRVLFGVRPDDAWVALGEGPDGILEVRFGWYRFRTTIGNVARWQIEGPFRWITAIGVRMSIRHRDITFGGSHHGGVRIDFRERVPWGVLRVPAIYVPADDLAGLGAELARRGIPGADVRKVRDGVG
jgi:hypothetical protein